MNYFKHYKNMPYKFLGVCRHSETLEELVLYETRYENPRGRLWVRPKEMFFENVTLNGVSRPRFEKVPMEIRSLQSLREIEASGLRDLYPAIFGGDLPGDLKDRLAAASEVLLLSARVEEKPVGFKLGYSLGKDRFYSWLGGVIPELRGLGIATDLLLAQEDWCRQKGYSAIETKCEESPMLILNLRQGYQVTGVEDSPRRRKKVVLEKSL